MPLNKTIEDRLKELEIEIPSVPKALGSYTPALISGNHIFVSGQLPIQDGTMVYKGILGRDLSIEQGYQASRLCAINSISAIKSVLEDLNKVKRIVKVNGYVCSDNKFFDQSKVINGASELFYEVFGEIGKHTRSAIGVACLPLESCVEIDVVAQF